MNYEIKDGDVVIHRKAAHEDLPLTPTMMIGIVKSNYTNINSMKMYRVEWINGIKNKPNRYYAECMLQKVNEN